MIAFVIVLVFRTFTHGPEARDPEGPRPARADRRPQGGHRCQQAVCVYYLNVVSWTLRILTL
jgi:hypothetical protein